MPRHSGNTNRKAKKTSSKAWRNGPNPGWRKTREVVLQRDGYQCQIQMPGVCTGLATCVDHIAGKAGGDDPRLLRAACEPCNSRYRPDLAIPDPRLSNWWES